MAEEIKPEGTGENQDQNNQQEKETDYQKKFEEEKALREKAEADAAAAKADVSKYQSEADKAKSLLGDKEKLDMQREMIAEDAHKLYLEQIAKDFPDVHDAYGDTFETLKGASKDEYVRQAQYLQAGLDKVKSKNAPQEEKKDETINSNNNSPAPTLPISGQDKPGERHIFTRAEIDSKKGDIKWYRDNKPEIDKQVAEGLVK